MKIYHLSGMNGKELYEEYIPALILANQIRKTKKKQGYTDLVIKPLTVVPTGQGICARLNKHIAGDFDEGGIQVTTGDEAAAA